MKQKKILQIKQVFYSSENTENISQTTGEKRDMQNIIPRYLSDKKEKELERINFSILDTNKKKYNNRRGLQNKYF